ncbi:tRNA adenine-N(1)--methyltransferase non-catalytic subunit [Neohortaea acidophila]|uniref:tRNA (adenine(58)-N(1))-methyltransferase non-catalytic subunit TRM6 n=1 Tax=Neohortaea acidophila TaxID=245834 RepID=A0A6A6PZL7_9PEZI|nr:tRNA adenine-N(1)--methyltransferase non-catalytic subunit [Neohortaea acidophila]KAF2484617.1 tRNA adenine-N(1)--methyltransferase non-catalytic subunit [Neohortaea acidophila]
MSTAHAHVQPNTFLFLRLPSELLKLVEIRADAIIDIGKFGSISSNSLLGRPYYHTYELLEKRAGEAQARIRVVPAHELNAEVVTSAPTPAESRDDSEATAGTNGVPEGYDLLSEERTTGMKNNRLTVDDASRQALSQQEIEELKKSSGGKEIIEKILANHAGLGEKTDFSKAKYMVRKTKKYLKRFTVLPMDLGTLMEYITVKEPARILELREESLGLMVAWSNVHCCPDDDVERDAAGKRVGGGRWLVIDETAGLLVAAVAERMGILFPDSEAQGQDDGKASSQRVADKSDAQPTADTSTTEQAAPKLVIHRDFPLPAPTNTITLLHPAVQPNVSLLKYFGYDTNQPDTTHPLHTHLKPLSWLSLLHPEEDPTYREPETATPAEMAEWKSGKRSAYFKKRRRWERFQSIVDEAREGGFDGLVMATSMDAASILSHTVPLVRGGGHIVIYSPAAEPLVKLVDLYSRDRRAAYMQHLAEGQQPNADDFPVDPRLLLAPSLQTSRARAWQVLPGRTHPVMGARGGAEGYVFTARKSIPLEGGVEARGNFTAKRRKVNAPPPPPSSDSIG